MKKLLPLLLGLALLSKTDAYGLALYCWDTNGDVPGSGISASPSGTWGVDPFWGKESFLGDKPTEAWPAGNFAIFSAGSDAIGAYTVYVSGIVTVADIHVDRGEVTFEPAPVTGGSLKLTDDVGNGANRLIDAGAFDDNAVARYNVPITDATSVIRYKVGTVIFGATNTFTGSLTIESGLTLCAVPYCFSAAPSLVLANLDMGRTDIAPAWQYWAAVFQTGGLDQQLGTLKFSGTNAAVERSLDLGNGAGTLSFADSSAEDWTGYTLTVKNYALGTSKLRFGTSNTGLTATQLSQIQFADYDNLPGAIDGDGYVTPAAVVPVQPTITAITHTSGAVELVWTAVNGRNYRVWSQDVLNPAALWNNLGDVAAVADTASFTDLSPSSTARYYRVEALP